MRNQLLNQRNSDMTLIVESKEAYDNGRKNIVLEPPSNQEWTRAAPPHMTSHWDTITSHFRDPPPRKPERIIHCYRRAFPYADQRPLTPRGPSWGGAPLPSLS